MRCTAALLQELAARAQSTAAQRPMSQHTPAITTITVTITVTINPSRLSSAPPLAHLHQVLVRVGCG